MKKSQKLLVASLVTLPVAVVVAGGVQAAETVKPVETVLPPLEISNSFVNKGPFSIPSGGKELLDPVKNEADLHKQILAEMQKFTKDFTIIYDDTNAATNYKAEVEGFFEYLKANLNTDLGGVDCTLLYGAFKNVKVEATEIATTVGETTTKTVKLKFSFNYSMDGPAQTALNNLATQLTTTIIKDGMTDVQKIKAVHDYVVINSFVDYKSDNLSELVLHNKGSANSYALLTYKLLKAAGISDVRYVAGVSGEGLRAWNLVKVGNEWYHLDVAANDNTEEEDSKHISYQYFLASNAEVKGRTINYGGITTSVTWGNAFSAFKNIVNPAQAENVLYYADAQTGGNIKKLEINGGVTESIVTTKATSGFGNIVYYMDVGNKYLYFINDAVGRYLYKYDFTDEKLSIVINESIFSIELDTHRLLYKTSPSSEGLIFRLDSAKDFNEKAAQVVIDAIVALNSANKDFKEKVLVARQKYNKLTPDQKEIVDNKQVDSKKVIGILKDHESELANTFDINAAEIINAINTFNVLDSGYFNMVKKTYEDFKKYLTEEEQEALYNSAILEQAYMQVLAAETLNKNISTLLSSVETGLKQNEMYIINIENAAKRYAELLPSLKVGIGSAQASFLNTYLVIAQGYREKVNELISKINNINDDSVALSDYLDKMAPIEDEYGELLESQKFLLSVDQEAKINKHITMAKKFKEQIADFEAHMAKLSTLAKLGPFPTLTAEQIVAVEDAKKLSNGMQPSQKGPTFVDNVELLDAILSYIKGASNTEDFKAAVDLITKLDYKKYKAETMADFKVEVEAVKTAVGKIQSSLISSVLMTKYNSYIRAVVGDSTSSGITEMGLEEAVSEVEKLIDPLEKNSTEADILKAKDAYNLLTDIQKHFADATKLFELEKGMADMEAAKAWDAEAQKILVPVAGEELSNADLKKGITELLTSFSRLSPGAQEIAKDTKLKLETLEKNIKEEEETEAAAIKAAEDVTKQIKALKASSKKEEIEKVRAAYTALTAAAKALVTEETLKLLVDAEKALADKEKEEQDKKQETEDKARALELDNAILAIAADTLLEDIEALYAEYGALSATVKAHMKEGKKLESIVTERRKQEVQDIKTAQDQAKLVNDRIAKITANYTEAQIRNIRTAYAALSARAKTYVTNLASLGAAEANIIYQNTVVKEAKNEAAAFDTYMTNLDRTSSTADIAKARAYYNRLSAEARKHVTAYTKLERLETMWSNPDYQDLYNNYYPHYLNEIPAGGIEIGQTNHVSLYIPDDSDRNEDYTNFAYTELAPTTDHYMTTITAQQVRHMNDKTLTLTASDNIKISIPMEELKNTKGTIAVYANVSNGSLIVRFTEDNVVKTFSGFVEIKMPITELSMTTANLLERTTNTSSSTAVNYYFDGKDIVIRTKQSGTFTSKNNTEIYNDLFSVNTDAAKAIRELAKRDITSGAIGKSYLPNSTAKRKDIAIMIARAVDVTTTKETKYQDIQNLIGGSTIQALLETSIMKGKTATQFSPYANVTRQEGAIILANMLRYLNDDVTKSHNEQTSNYTDVKALTHEAKQSIAILEIAGVLDGEGEFDPTAQLTRAEFAEMLYKTMQNAKLL